MKKTMLAMSMMLLGFTAMAQNTNRLMNHYIKVKDALIAGDNKAAEQEIDMLYQAVKSEPNFTQKTQLVKATEKLNSANNLEQQRAAFNEVSTNMWMLVKKSEKVDHEVYYQYCPMKKAYWLSYEKDIKNPYYGSSMLTCGKVVETKK